MNWKFNTLLKRKTSGGNFIPEIDGLRFFAIFTVLIFHLNTAYSREIGVDWLNNLPDDGFLNLGWWIVRMDLGVKVFFGISGFILAVPFIKHYWYGGRAISLKQYFIRRLTRLEPPFVVTLILFFLVHILVLGADYSEMLSHFWASLFYLHTIIYEMPSIINPVTWSLETEVQFYSLIPFLAMLIFFKRHSAWVLICLLLLFSASIFAKNYIYSNSTPGWDFTIFVFLSNFLTGFFFALAYLHYQHYFKTKSFLWDIFGLISIFTLFYFYKPQVDMLNNLLFNISIFLLFIATFKGHVFNWFFSRSIIYLVGGMCYTIYLIHYPFFHLLMKFTGRFSVSNDYFPNLMVQLMIGIPIVIFVSIIFFVLIEKPCMDKDWPKKLKMIVAKMIN
ncbi:MAG: acyltransferase [Mongoliibacter sp.]|uniref:acyltransferase family protein n=1 Tax=Mongoliibacter sp. TaxID=2022438 RepID=UPI0012F3A219|nr:acyltransferase [Mongoliibacter sp.]TVP46538.1 MAG: acyltransferase [Mongoliibacter sp.]